MSYHMTRASHPHKTPMTLVLYAPIQQRNDWKIPLPLGLRHKPVVDLLE